MKQMLYTHVQWDICILSSINVMFSVSVSKWVQNYLFLNVRMFLTTQSDVLYFFFAADALQNQKYKLIVWEENQECGCFTLYQPLIRILYLSQTGLHILSDTLWDGYKWGQYCKTTVLVSCITWVIIKELLYLLRIRVKKKKKLTSNRLNIPMGNGFLVPLFLEHCTVVYKNTRCLPLQPQSHCHCLLP